MLSTFNSSKPLHLGFRSRIPLTNNTFVTGGPGYVLTKEAIRRFVEIALVKMKSTIAKHTLKNTTAEPCISVQEGSEDINLGK